MRYFSMSFDFGSIFKILIFTVCALLSQCRFTNVINSNRIPAQHLFHFCLQPQNIVLMGQFPNCEIKLCDLEVARVIKEDEDICEIIGTPDYVGKLKLDLIQEKMVALRRSRSLHGNNAHNKLDH